MGFNFEKSSSYLVCPKCHADLVKDGDTSANVAVLPGDVVIIPQSWF